MDPFHLAVALGPVSVYLLLLGRINLATRPFVTTGARDTFALALATAGFFVAGPFELFMPEGAAAYLGAWIWLPLLSLYVLSALLISTLGRPRLLVYNISAERLHPVLELVAQRLDPDHRWAGGSLYLPQLGLQLAVDALPSLRHVQLVSAGSGRQELAGWRQLELALKSALKTVEVRRNPRGYSFVTLGVLIAALVLLALNRQPDVVAEAIDNFLRR